MTIMASLHALVDVLADRAVSTETRQASTVVATSGVRATAAIGDERIMLNSRTSLR